MIQKKLLKLAIVGLTAGLFISAQSVQTKEIPQQKNEVVAEKDAQLSKAADLTDQKEVAMMKETVGDMQKMDKQDSCNKPACKTCNECTPAKPCHQCSKCEQKPCSKCEPKGCVKETPKKCAPCSKCGQKTCGCKKCDEASSSNKGAAKTVVEG